MATAFLRLLSCLCFAGTITGFLTNHVDLTSPLVFDPTFYVNTHYDVHRFSKLDEVKHHWITTGIKEGRQACGSFHSKQYLKRYADLSKQFGSNYREAIEHYIQKGVTEKRLGYVEGGAEGRWTISSTDHSVHVSGSRRVAGAIDSVVWNHKEFINSWDHGREMQIAVNTQPFGECFNPTEAGGRDDGRKDSTTSQLLHISAHGNTLKTTTHPAFWMRPGDTENPNLNSYCKHGTPAMNKEKVYGHDFSKTVTIGCAGLNHCIKFVSNITIAGHWPTGYQGFNLEAVTGYLTGDFHSINNYDLAKRQTHGYSSHSKPVILKTVSGSHAMGVFAPTGQDTDAMFYNGHSFGTSFTSGTNKWGIGMRKKKIPDGSSMTLIYTVYICVGSHHMVTDCLDTVHRHYPSLKTL